MKGRFAVHPVFFATYPIVLLYTVNAGQVVQRDFIEALAASLLLATVFMGVSWGILRDVRKAALLTSLLMFYFFFFRWANMPLHSTGLPIPRAVSRWILLPLHLAAFAAVVVWLLRTSKTLHNATHVLNVVGVFLLATSFLPLLTHRTTTPALPQPVDAGPLDPSFKAPLSYRPDIYFIVLDQYPRTDTLRNVFKYDNSAFLGQLRGMGFTVLTRCASNYPRTTMSISSTLNMNYLDVLLGKVREDNMDLGIPAKLVSHSAAFAFVHARGYRTVYIPPEFGAGTPVDVDVFLDSTSRLSDFHRVLIDMTPIQDIMDAASAEFSPAELHRRHVRYSLEQLRRLPRMGHSPMFVYAHIICPHAPIVFGAEGEPVDALLLDEPRADWSREPGVRAAYAQQVAFISSQAVRVVRDILDRSPRPPVIILCSDHGTEFEVDWGRPEKSNLQERMANLQCYYLPAGGEKLLYPTMTNVNMFRLVFSYYLGGKYELLPDRSYFSPSRTPYRFVHVPMDSPVTHMSEQ